MIRGIIGYQVLSYKDVEPVFMQLRSHAMNTRVSSALRISSARRSNPSS
jgi:hypothetical protein